MQTSRHRSIAAALAAHHAAGAVAAIRFGESPDVELVDTGERMPIEEFAQRYPAGLILWWHAPDDRR